VVELRSRTTAVLAWALWLVTFGCCAAGLLVTLAIVPPLTVGVLGEGALYAARARASSCAGSPPGWRPRWPGC
jgi:hypothetical protein